MSSLPPQALPASKAPLSALTSLDNPRLRRVRERDEWRTVREMRYDALHRRGDIAPLAEREFGDAHDAALNAITFVLEGPAPIGTTRSSVRSARRRWPLPSEEVFSPEMDTALGADATLVEASLTLVDRRAAIDPRLALVHLFRAHILHCAAENADWLIAAVRDSQIGFYRRVFGMEILSGAETYGGLATPRVLMGLPYREQGAMLGKRIPALALVEDDERDAAALFAG